MEIDKTKLYQLASSSDIELRNLAVSIIKTYFDIDFYAHWKKFGIGIERGYIGENLSFKYKEFLCNITNTNLYNRTHGKEIIKSLIDIL